MDNKATLFEFTSYKFEPASKRIFFNYTTKFSGQKPLVWTETIILPEVPDMQGIPKEIINKLLESLHLILGISYYKAYCPPTVALAKESAILSKGEAHFWNTVYKKGLGEFFYQNKLDPEISPKFQVTNRKSATISNFKFHLPAGRHGISNSRYLVGIGGGKDSIVAVELLKEAGVNITAFAVETGTPSELIKNVIDVMDIGSLKIQRILDPKIYGQNQYSGHIPVSAIYAFLGILSCVLYKYDSIIVSNEHSSNFGSIKYKGLEVNHQWSKSFEFETLFQTYITKLISPDASYFSLLRSFYEIRIVELFSRYRKYFPYFSSCNNNFKTDKKSGGLWCGQCAKCVFVFTLLSAFLPKNELLKIFGQNLYEKENLLPLFKDILGFGKMKPFDCVGTFQEAQTAFFMARKTFAKTFIVRHFDSLRSLPSTSFRVNSVSRIKYFPDVFQTAKENAVPEEFKLLGMEKVLILGYGKEGRITRQYLKKQYPKLKIGVGDETLDKNYLENQVDFDIAIKTPSIKKELVAIPCTTATNIFFSSILPAHTIVGVTGSKGKSTTASLIAHILKTAGKNVQLLGNIGTPMLGALLQPIKKNTIFVLELSSYQLDDIGFSPHIAVVTSLFPEHLDYHGTLKNYYQAKKNIIKTANYFVYHPKNLIMRQWVKEYNGEPVPFSAKNYESSLLGQHNQSDIGAAVAAAKILNIPQEKIKKAVKSFKGLPHRLEFVGEFGGIKFYDDAISTTPESTIMAIKALRTVGTIFLGGTDRGYNFIQLEKTLKRYNIRNIVLFPDSGKRILKSTKGFKILKTKSMREAVQFAYQHTPKGSVCLLSCASPSYSLWKNFEEKGQEFQLVVKKMAKT